MDRYASFQHLLFQLSPEGVLLITINRPAVLNAANARLHWELSHVWGVVSKVRQQRGAGVDSVMGVD